MEKVFEIYIKTTAERLWEAITDNEIYVNGHRCLPSYGHRFSPLAVTLAPRWWPSVLPSTLSSRSRARR
ncbi:MAG: hypothetical protein QOI48_4335, partial [Solirubrobacteraceae bacterium]|nr:hypothetical protein [Solirubrobacteraceae bacterium]